MTVEFMQKKEEPWLTSLSLSRLDEGTVLRIGHPQFALRNAGGSLDHPGRLAMRLDLDSAES